jgi:hypothetical protein
MVPIYEVIEQRGTIVSNYNGGSRRGQVRPILVLALFSRARSPNSVYMLVYDFGVEDLRNYIASRVEPQVAFLDKDNTGRAIRALKADMQKGGARGRVNSLWSVFSRGSIPPGVIARCTLLDKRVAIKNPLPQM